MAEGSNNFSSTTPEGSLGASATTAPSPAELGNLSGPPLRGPLGSLTPTDAIAAMAGFSRTLSHFLLRERS